MALQLFVDETKRRDFAMAVVEVKSEHIADRMRAMRRQLRGGQRRLHFTRESAGRRSANLAEMALDKSAGRRVVERDEAHDVFDRRVSRGS